MHVMRWLSENGFLARFPALVAEARDIPCIREVLFALALTLLAVALLFLAGFELGRY